ncbi:HNH/ENDO VII family nuclease [Paraliobacillus sp. JSM ZJ581]|uniref:HNH/ENDO VII family nuclease n=1 Tax=Paraliobacillus sp. JSM ZJ581 TaxID=3342118 RepID=UPI0035A94B35
MKFITHDGCTIKEFREGIDPVTGEKLTATQQAAAAAMLAAGLIPVFGWVGKGGVAIYKTTKAVNATTAVFDMYKTTKSLQVIKNTEYGMYGLVSANGFSEYLTGKDILGNELTTSQRQASLSLGLAGMLPTAIELTPASKGVTKDITKKAHERVVRNTQSARAFVDHWFNGLVSQTDVAMAGGPRLPINAMRDTHVQQEIHTSFAKVTKGTVNVYKYWNKTTEFNNVKVYQRDDIIDPSMVDARGRTNLDRMKKGLAPLGPDGKSINFHHTTQRNTSSIAEVTQIFHKENSSVIHINPNTIPSGINRTEFNKRRTDYWKNRANDF